MNDEDIKYIYAWAECRYHKWLILRWCLLGGSVLVPCLYFWLIRTLDAHTNFLETGMGSAGMWAFFLVIASVPGVYVLSLMTLVYTIGKWKDHKLASILEKQTTDRRTNARTETP